MLTSKHSNVGAFYTVPPV